MDYDPHLLATLEELFRDGKIADAQRLIIDALQRGIALPHGPTLSEIEDAAMARALGLEANA